MNIEPQVNEISNRLHLSLDVTNDMGVKKVFEENGRFRNIVRHHAEKVSQGHYNFNVAEDRALSEVRGERFPGSKNSKPKETVVEARPDPSIALEAERRAEAQVEKA